MKKINKYLLALIILSGVMMSSAVDHNPRSNGTTNARNLTGNSFESTFHNPALLGVERMPKGGLLLFPITDYGIGVYSDKLALSPFNKYWVDSLREMSALTTKIFNESFGLKGLSPVQVSKKLTEELKGGINTYAGFKTSIFTLAVNRFAVDLQTHFDEQVHIPEAPLMMIFSETDGLLRGETFDLTDQKQEGIWATDLTFQLGLPVAIPALNDFFKLRFGAGGIGLKYVMGHSVLRAVTEKGKLTYNGSTNALDVDAQVRVQTAGTGLSNYWNSKNPFDGSFPINGHGIGVEIGGILYDDKGSLSVNVQNLGVLFWMNDVREATYYVKKSDLDAYDIIKGYEEYPDSPEVYIFNHRAGDEFSNGAKFEESNGFATFLPLGLNIGYAYTWDFEKIKTQGLRFLAEYGTVAANYEQQLMPYPGRSFIPRFTLGGEAGVMHGFIPMRLGFVLGGPEIVASSFCMGFNLRYFTIEGSYKAVGTLWMYPKRGVELAGGLGIQFGMNVDSDRDGIPDRIDKCPFKAEDKDNFEDEDGCPDYDNDGDGIPDTLDKCPNAAEDKDSFQDNDGCPDYDNDNDAIPDSVDKCPMEKEDKDNFKDEDGCPDYDNDGDAIPDSVDKCPNLAEDIDMFEDNDGCPDYDNDKDGIADTVDNCIMEPETFNGYRDNDGCPDTLIKPTETETKALNTKLRAINFKTASAELLPASNAALDYIVTFLRQYPYLRYEIQGHTDAQGSDDYNMLLSAARAGTVRSYLLAKGIADSNLIAIGYGETRPIDDNNTAKGRAVNRRVEFTIIDSNDEYSRLKGQEVIFREQIKNAKIKGAGY